MNRPGQARERESRSRRRSGRATPGAPPAPGRRDRAREERYAASKWGAAPAAAALPPPPTHWRHEGRCRLEPDRALPLKLLLNVTATARASSRGGHIGCQCHACKKVSSLHNLDVLGHVCTITAAKYFLFLFTNQHCSTPIMASSSQGSKGTAPKRPSESDSEGDHTPSKRCSTEPQPSSSGSPNSFEDQGTMLQRLMEMMTKEMQTIENLTNRISTMEQNVRANTNNIQDQSIDSADSTESEGSRAPSGSATGASDLQESLRNRISEAERRLEALRSAPSTSASTATVAGPSQPRAPLELNFPPFQVVLAEPKIPKADPMLAEQGSKCQRFGEAGWKNIRYDSVKRKFHATPVFTSLGVNCLLGNVTPNTPALKQLEKFDEALASITHGLLQQRKTFEETCKTLDKPTQRLISKNLIGKDCKFRQISDDLLQYTCGRRAQVIQQRRQVYRHPNREVNRALHDIPPSTTHLFDEDRLTELMRESGGYDKFFPHKNSRNKRRKQSKPRRRDHSSDSDCEP